MNDHPDADHPAAGGPSRPPQQVTVRRAPRYRAFVSTGVAIAVVIAAVLVWRFPETGEFTTRAVFGYLAVGLGLIGGVLGGLIAVLLERPGRRKR